VIDVKQFEAQKILKVLSLQSSAFPKYIFLSFLGLFLLPTLWQQHIDENVYGACGGMISREGMGMEYVVARYRERKTEVFGTNSP
jgi:hypothetical protein